MDCPATCDLTPRLRELYPGRILRWHSPAGSLELALPADVFSSFQVDRGTRELLREIASAGPRWGRALDLGCGYGPIALYLASAGLAGRVDAVDRDALAVAFTRFNARANGLAGVEARGALAYEAAEAAAYDAVISNLPAKAGLPVHRMMLLGAARHLREGGEVWLVVVAPLADEIDRILADSAVALRAKTRHKDHVVYRYGFTGRPDLPADPYLRDSMAFRWGNDEYGLEVLHGLAEFDARGWATDLVVQVFEELSRRDRPRRLAFCEPGQGHLAVLACRVAGNVEEVTIVSRDLIALDATRRNLTLNGCGAAFRALHAADFALGPDARADWALALLNEKEGLAVNAEKLRALLAEQPGRRAVAGCRAAFGSRLAAALRGLGMRASVRKKRRGFCALYTER